MPGRASKERGNTECPDSKGIKTAIIYAMVLGGGNTECPDSKGIKTKYLHPVPLFFGNTECPDSKGIKTSGKVWPVGVSRNTECPDSKGIKTSWTISRLRFGEILNALIQKGLRHQLVAHCLASSGRKKY